MKVRALQTNEEARDAARALASLYLVRNVTRNTVVASRVRLAGNSHDRRIGLSHCRQLDPQEGLLLSPCEAIHTFGMRFPLDVLFIDPGGKVRALRQGLRPRRMAACWRARSTLELAPGAIRASATGEGDLLEFLNLSEADPDGGETS